MQLQLVFYFILNSIFGAKLKAYVENWRETTISRANHGDNE
jgi:hypothetical protein